MTHLSLILVNYHLLSLSILSLLHHFICFSRTTISILKYFLSLLHVLNFLFSVYLPSVNLGNFISFIFELTKFFFAVSKLYVIHWLYNFRNCICNFKKLYLIIWIIFFIVWGDFFCFLPFHIFVFHQILAICVILYIPKSRLRHLSLLSLSLYHIYFCVD